MNTSRNLVRGAVAAAALAMSALLPAGAASAAPAPAPEVASAPAAVDVCTVLYDGTAFFDLNDRVIGFVNAGQKMNVTGHVRGFWIGTLWGRTDRSKVSSQRMSCPV
jgi:hypothetical protein